MTAIRRYLPLLTTGAAVVLVIGGLGWLIYGAMQTPPPKTKKVVTQVNLIAPPPPPPEIKEMPEPEIEEEVDIPEPEEALPEPDLADIPDGPMGLDADGMAGMDAFGLAARRGGVDITAMGDPYAWYKDSLSSHFVSRIAEIESIRKDNYEVQVRLWLDAKGNIEKIVLQTSTGDKELDKELKQAISSVGKVSEAPPPGMPNPVRLRFICRT